MSENSDFDDVKIGKSFYKCENNIIAKPLTDKCIILDLDETLVYSNQNIETLHSFNIYKNPKHLHLRKRIYRLKMYDVIDKKGNGVITELWGITRPYLKEFLIMCFNYFRIVAVWSAGQKNMSNH